VELHHEWDVADTETFSNSMAYAHQVDSFANAVEGKAKFPVPGDEGWKNQQILDAAYRSIKSGKAEEVEEIAAKRRTS
jgi:predicted dehydrogenase